MSVTEQDLVAAFPPEKAWRDPIPGIPPEIIGIEADFRGKHWTEITTSDCNKHHDAYNMLDTEPLAFFLPAFLRSAIIDPRGCAAEWLVYFVCSRQSDDLYDQFNSEQRDVLQGVVALILNFDTYFEGEKTRFLNRLREWDAR